LSKSLYNSSAELAKEELNLVSCSMCLAKWTQVTMHLHNGHTHSCHHPAPHFITLEELKDNPHALHNTKHKIEQRKQMLEGKQPAECNYCWNIENLNQNHLSDRHYKSGEDWNAGQLEKIKLNPLDNKFLPTYVEVSFNNTCNFACMYCSPQISSKWMEDVKQHGGYDIGEYEVHNLDYMKKNNLIPIIEREENPYIDAFWKIWPELYTNLKVFRITGGEPLLSKHTWKILKYIQDNPNPNLILGINTNLGVNDIFIDRLIEICNDLINNNKIKNLEIYTSVESVGEQAEYIRDGLDYNKFIVNLNRVTTEIPMLDWKSKTVIMATYNLLSIPKFRDLLEWVLEWRTANGSNTWKKLWLDISYLTYPNWQTVALADKKMIKIMQDDLAFMQHNKEQLIGHHGFQDTEISKMLRAIEFAKSHLDKDKTKEMKQFYKFQSAYDTRRNKNFVQTFPELEQFYNQCKELLNG
tara:strand:+ start:18491 stop:19894 length:1404 start_codon:yes stop_codon:yes gene_type:complete